MQNGNNAQQALFLRKSSFSDNIKNLNISINLIQEYNFTTGRKIKDNRVVITIAQPQSSNLKAYIGITFAKYPLREKDNPINTLLCESDTATQQEPNQLEEIFVKKENAAEIKCPSGYKKID